MTAQSRRSIRVSCPRQYWELYADLKGVLFADHHELFHACACLGYHDCTRGQITSRRELFYADTIGPDEWASYRLIHLATGGQLDVISEWEPLVRLAEEYATGGMQVMAEEVLRGLVEQVGDAWRLVRSASAALEAPQAALYEFFQRTQGLL